MLRPMFKSVRLLRVGDRFLHRKDEYLVLSEPYVSESGAWVLIERVEIKGQGVPEWGLALDILTDVRVLGIFD